MPVGVNRNDQQLHIAGDNRGDGGALHAQGGSAELSVDQHPVQEQVRSDGNDPGHHGGAGFPGFPQGAGIHLGHGERHQAPEHHAQVSGAQPLRQGKIPSVAFSLQEGSDEGGSENQVDPDGKSGAQQDEIHFDADGVAHALRVALAEELGAEDARAAQAPENGQHLHHEHGIGNGGRGDSLRAQRANHDIVQKGNKGRDELLDQHGNQQRQDTPVESLRTDKPPEHPRTAPLTHGNTAPLYMSPKESQPGVFLVLSGFFPGGGSWYNELFVQTARKDLEEV